jgi:hypothetical protein
MEIVIHAEGFLPTDTLREHVFKRLRSARCAVGSRVRAVRVLLLPGTRTGTAGSCSGPKSCTLVADVEGGGTVEVASQDLDLYRAVGFAVTRLKSRLRREPKVAERVVRK